MSFRIYNGETNNKSTGLFLGKDSGIRDYDDLRYPIALQLNKDLFGEYWIEDEIKLAKDIEDYRNVLSKPEQYAYKMQTGALNWLDSLATDFNFQLSSVMTDSGFRSVFAIINSFEVLHNRSYQYLTSSVLNDAEKKECFEDIKHIPEMIERNMHIIKPIQEMIEVLKRYNANEYVKDEFKVTDEELMQAIFKGIVNYQVLEGLYFSGGFVFFHSLARSNKMLGSNSMISLIREDENQHSVVYGMVLQILMAEFPALNTKENLDYAVSQFKTAVELEKKWARHILKGIDTLSIKEYDDYIEYLANLIMRNSGMKDIYLDNTELKSKWINTYGAKHRPKQDGIATRTDFLQRDPTEYGHDGGSDFDL
ncbi:ribonucleoside-diphosphate reductase subunit beta [Lysinibacillus phage LC76P1]|nr:ribonucleoside-diphosphate reductase subunit beta [Lysinibacillus phage LC76P1]